MDPVPPVRAVPPDVPISCRAVPPDVLFRTCRADALRPPITTAVYRRLTPDAGDPRDRDPDPGLVPTWWHNPKP